MPNLVLYGILASLLAGLATGGGALPILLNIRVTDRLLDALLGGAADVVLAATSFSLIVPGIETGARVAGEFWGVWLVVLGMMAGALFLHKADDLIPHKHFEAGPEGPSSSFRKTWLFVISDEIIPETHSRGNHLHATFGVMVGFIIMMSMDNLLG